jgi:cell division protein FtsA
MASNTTPKMVRNGLVAALDVGTTKVCCLIARANIDRGLYQKPGMKIIGIGHHVSGGMRSGTVVALEECEAAIRSTVELAEQMAGENIRDVVVNLSGGHPRSRLIAYEISIAGHEIGDADLRRILDPQVLKNGMSKGRELVHTIPVGYSIDGNRGVRDPRGMFGERLGVNLHVISALSGPVRNLETSVMRCHLGVAEKVVSAYASALACLVEDETQLGVTCIDMGGGTTSMAVFFDGELVHTNSIPVGGVHVTNDIARGLSTPLAHAERMKTLYGSALASPSDDREVIKVPLVGEESAKCRVRCWSVSFARVSRKPSRWSATGWSRQASTRSPAASSSLAAPASFPASANLPPTFSTSRCGWAARRPSTAWPRSPPVRRSQPAPGSSITPSATKPRHRAPPIARPSRPVAASGA